MGERQAIAATQSLAPVRLDAMQGWHTVGDAMLSFDLHAPASILLSYGLPATQHQSPRLGSALSEWTYERWSSIATRVVVDGIAYTHAAGASLGAVRRTVEQRGQLVLNLPAGTHTAVLQWASFFDENGVSWTTIGEGYGGFEGGPELLVLINAQNNEPRLYVWEAVGGVTNRRASLAPAAAHNNHRCASARPPLARFDCG